MSDVPTFSEPKRYDYPLSERSFVVDVGGYEGNFSREIHNKYGCRVDCYEPVKAFFEKCAKTLRSLDKVRLYNFGVSSHNETQTLHIQNDSTGFYAGSEITETCQMLGIAEVLKIASTASIDLIKLNCEGGEYDILSELLRGDQLVHPSRFANIQVQFHTCVPDYQARYDIIAAKLSVTHELTWRSPFVWENWRRKA